jgi:hypothetical protein
MSLPNGLTPAMVRKALLDEHKSISSTPILDAETAAKETEKARLEGLEAEDLEAERSSAELAGASLTAEQYRFQQERAKGEEARIRAICDSLGIDHSGWNP